ncbi:hypothetical protein D3C81_1983400 [compost metagenome]
MGIGSNRELVALTRRTIQLIGNPRNGQAVTCTQGATGNRLAVRGIRLRIQRVFGSTGELDHSTITWECAAVLVAISHVGSSNLRGTAVASATRGVQGIWLGFDGEGMPCNCRIRVITFL